MIDKSTVLQVLGCLLQHPLYLSESDKYNLSPKDFETKLDKYVFVAIDTLYRNGAQCIKPIDIENYLETNPTASETFKKSNGLEYIQDAIDLSEVGNFPYYYTKLKKFNLLNSMHKLGLDTSGFYIDDLTNPRALEINAEFEHIEINDILTYVKKQVLALEKAFEQKSNVETWSVDASIDQIVAGFGDITQFGLPINGDITSEILNGAALGALTIRSLSSGLGKTRLAVADACKLAYPFYFDTNTMQWVKNGHTEPTLFIMTEQSLEEIGRMIIAYLSGIEDSKLRFGMLNPEERARVAKTQMMIHHYPDNLTLMRIPDPDIQQVKLAVREKVVTMGIKYVFYDYIFVSPALLSEFKGINLRNDEALLLMATALKDLAQEQNVCVFTSTQVNAKADDNTNIRNEASLAGGRATINKADNGLIGMRPTKEELNFLGGELIPKCGGVAPNLVMDVFKVRGGRWTQVRIWSYWDTGTLRLHDLFVTDSFFNAINIYADGTNINWELDSVDMAFLNEMNGVAND